MNFYIMDLSRLRRDIKELTEVLYIDTCELNSLFSDLFYLISDTNGIEDKITHYAHEYIMERKDKLEELINLHDKIPRVTHLLAKISKSIINILDAYQSYRSGKHSFEYVQLYKNSVLVLKDADLGNQTTGT